MNAPPELWTQLTHAAQLPLSASQQLLLGQYLDLLLEANQTMNLTRLTDRAVAEVLHVADALTLLPFLPAGPIALADVGSGGGCPGIPLAIVRPDAQITCIESTGKKAAFLRKAGAALGLANLHVAAARAEDVGRGPARETFDVAVARALGTMDWVAEFCLPLVTPRGKLLAMKGPKAPAELAAAASVITRLGGANPVIHAVSLPGATGHVIVEIAKRGHTDKRFPRSPTQTKGKPLT